MPRVFLLPFAMLFAMLFASPCLAQEAAPASNDPALEQRVMAIAMELRCLVCQNQTIADSHAPLAIDLRNQVRDQLRSGKDEDAIKDYMVARYGEFVLYRPQLKATTLLLWFGPFALLAGGLTFLFLYLRKRRTMQQQEMPLDDTQRARARQLLDSGENEQ